jgi:hypothetical protein
VVDFTAPESPGPAGCTQDYAGPLGENSLMIEQSAGRLQMPGPGPAGWTAIRVRGLPGRATRNMIIWRENGLTDLIMVARPQWSQVLTTTQLVAMADSALQRAPPGQGGHASEIRGWVINLAFGPARRRN